MGQKEARFQEMTTIASRQPFAEIVATTVGVY
jgi:hypothetical protein